METFITLVVVVGLFLILLAIYSSLQKKKEQERRQAFARYEKVKRGELSESELNEQERALLQQLRAEKTCTDIDESQLMMWMMMMHYHNVLPQSVVQPYEANLQASFPQVYETYQQCYNSYCYYNSGGSYSGYSSYSSY